MPAEVHVALWEWWCDECSEGSEGGFDGEGDCDADAAIHNAGHRIP